MLFLLLFWGATAIERGVGHGLDFDPQVRVRQLVHGDGGAGRAAFIENIRDILASENAGLQDLVELLSGRRELVPET